MKVYKYELKKLIFSSALLMFLTTCNVTYRFTQIFGVEAYVCVIFGAAELAAALWVARREKKVDVVE
jgi:hypothetical protein